jgi:hypothetical protein
VPLRAIQKVPFPTHRHNEGSNFHHITALRREIKRIRLLARDCIVEERRHVECGLLGWKLLHKLKIYPEDEYTFNLINTLESIKRGDHPNLQKQFEQQ